MVRVRDHAPSFEIIQGVKRYELSPGVDAGELAAVEMELLWSPDSSALSLSWNINAITTQTELYKMTSEGPKRVSLSAIRQDFYHDYPACVGFAPSEWCPYAPDGTDNTLLAVGWDAPHTLALMAEASESSGYGKNMSQVEGFEVDAHIGKVTRKMNAAEFKKRWQSHMGWTFHIPAPPG